MSLSLAACSAARAAGLRGRFFSFAEVRGAGAIVYIVVDGPKDRRAAGSGGGGPQTAGGGFFAPPVFTGDPKNRHAARRHDKKKRKAPPLRGETFRIVTAVRPAISLCWRSCASP